MFVRPSVTTRYRFKPRWDRDSGFLCARARSAKRVLAIVIMSVCLSVCPSVYHNPVPNQAHVKQRLRVYTYANVGYLVSCEQISNEGIKYRYPLQNRRIMLLSSYSKRTVADRHRLHLVHIVWQSFTAIGRGCSEILPLNNLLPIFFGGEAPNLGPSVSKCPHLIICESFTAIGRGIWEI